MSFRFRAKVGPFIWDEKLGGQPKDARRPILTAGDWAALAFAAAALVFMVVTVVIQ